MKKHLPGIGIVLLFTVMLLSPRAVFTGASEGLLLWFQIVLPTLFPFILITNLLIQTGSMQYLAKAAGRLFGSLFGVSRNGSFAVIAGFLCGYPMGAKVTADLVVSGYISPKEGRYLLSFCNNTSPVFILNFIVWKTLNRKDLLLPSLVILLGTPLLMSFPFRRLYFHCQPTDSASAEKSAQHKNSTAEKKHGWDSALLDTCIMDSFEAITKVGGYIILFSVLLTLLTPVTARLPFFSGLLASLEVTNGIIQLNQMALPFSVKYILILTLTSFGGFCSVAQTQCMVQKAGLPLLPYIIEKLATAAVTSLFACCYIFYSSAGS